jgi:hypothetical protein
MDFLKRKNFPVVAGFMIVVLIFSCEQDLTTIGSGVIGGEPFATGKVEYDVFAFNKKIEAVQTNKLPLYQLGTFDDPIYGKTNAIITTQIQLPVGANPSFGAFSQSVEDNSETDDRAATIPENETIIEALLYIPYLTKGDGLTDSDRDGVDDIFDDEPNDPTNDSDGDGLSNNEENSGGTDPLNADTDGDGETDDVDDDTDTSMVVRRIDIDSIYGNRETPFTLKVESSNYFLRDRDPNTDFIEDELYFSNQILTNGPSEVLFEGGVDISDFQILVQGGEDDPDTEVDESEQFEKIAPGIRVPLNSAFFQENILDQEGTSNLLSQANFNEFLRGIHLTIEPNEGDEHYLLLDLRQATILLKYKYDAVDNNGTADDTSDDVIEKRERDFTMNLLRGEQNGSFTGNAVNTFITETLPAEITDAVQDTVNNANRIYLKGGAGTYAEIRLFDNDGDESAEAINQIRTNKWIINEANLVFYVDRDRLDAEGVVVEPPRLYLYNARTNQPLFDANLDRIDNTNSLASYPFYGGILEENNGKGVKYSVRITSHINNMIVRDSANAKLGLTITSDIRSIGSIDTMIGNDELIELPVISTISPLGTVLFGSNVDAANADKKLKLEIFYTEAN